MEAGCRWGRALVFITDGDRSGSSIALSSDGRILAIGAPLSDEIDASAGNVKVFIAWLGQLEPNW